MSAVLNKICQVMLLWAASTIVLSKDLVFSYWDYATPPFAISSESGLTGGIIKDLGDAVSQKLGSKPEYVKLPVKRVELHMQEGKVDVTCITNPIWKAEPDKLFWSPTLFNGADRFLVRKADEHTIQSFSDLKGKSLGIYKGYTYHPEIMALIETESVNAVKVSDVEKGMLLVKLGRLDALIDFGVILRYQISQQKLENELALAAKHADDFELSCAYSPKLPADKREQLDAVFRELIDSGTVNQILQRYR